MKVGVRTHDGREARLTYAEQIGAHGGSIWLSALPGYAEKGYAEVAPMRELKERFDAHGLVLNAGGLGAQVIKNQLMGRDGREREMENVCKTIRNMDKSADIPIIILTALSDAETMNDALLFGAVDYIVKPFDIRALREKIDSAVNKSQARKKNKK